MKYEIVIMDGLYVIFRGDRMVCACETLKQAKEAVARDKAR